MSSVSRAPAPSVCAVHPGQPAFVTCRRCGAYACEYCLGQDGEVCSSCTARDEGGGVIAWERRDLGMLARFGRTVRQVLARTGQTFAELRPGSVPAALGYVALVYALTSLVTLFVLAPCVVLSFFGWQTPIQVGDGAAVAPVMVAALCGGPPLQALVGMATAVVLGLVYHAAVKLAGGRGGIDVSLRTAAYGLTVVLVWAPLTVVLLLPTLGLVVMGIVLVAQLVWGANVGVTVARAHHGLDGARAVFAGWLPAALALLLVGLTLGGAWLVRDVTEPSRAPDVYEPVYGY